MVNADRTGMLEQAFGIEPFPFGRIEGIGFCDQVGFEGWILGVI